MSVTLSKMALRNAQRQARDYLVYFVTVVMAAALLYAFNGLVFSQEVQTLSKSLSSLRLVLVLASIVVVCVFGWLVSYATGFMLSRRGRELGTYLLIGLTNKQVARLFFLENLVVGGCALVFGAALGSLLYQMLRAILFALFGLPYRFAFGFSVPALGLTVAYFALIYLFALCRSRKYIRRAKIHDLIYVDQVNENIVIQTGNMRRWIFSASIVLGAAGTCLLMAGGAILGIIGAGCVIVFLFGFFLSFASGVPAFFEKRPGRKYQGQNLLVFRTLTAKLATMGMLMAIISLIFTATLVSEGAGMMFRGLFESRAAESGCFDLYLGSEDGTPLNQDYFSYIQANIPVEQSLNYSVYHTEDSRVLDYVVENEKDYFCYLERDPVLRYSDYAALRDIAGYSPVELKPGEYLIHCWSYLEEHLANYPQPLSVGSTRLTLGGVYTEHLMQDYNASNGTQFTLVVPDDAAEGLPVHHYAYAAKTAQPVTYEQFYGLYEIHGILEEQDPTRSYDTIRAKALEESDAAAWTADTAFPLFYLALALTMAAATILTIQQLSETERYRRQFRLLQKLGMDRREMARTLRNQFAIYYAMPAVPTLLIGVPLIFNLASQPEPGVMVGMNSPLSIVTIALGIFFLIYAIYILLAYTSLKRNVMPT